MAESSDKIPPPNRPLNSLLRCFGSSPKVRIEKDPLNGRRNRRVPWLRFRFKKSSATVPVLDAALPKISERCPDGGYFSPEPINFKAPAAAVGGEKFEDVTSGSELTRPSRCTTGTSQTRKKTESTQSDSAAERTAVLLNSVSLPVRRPNRQKDLKKSVSQLPAAAASASPARQSANSPARYGNPNPRKKLDPAIIMVAVAIVVLWGRLCAILCTAALFYFGRRLRSEVEPDGGGENPVLNRDGGIS